jgi:hypothetical protein
MLVQRTIVTTRTSVEFKGPDESCWTSYADRRAKADRPPAA